MPSLDIAKLKLLLRFYAADAEAPTVTGIARETGEPKYTISRTIRALAGDGFLDNSESRHIVLTEKGKIASIRSGAGSFLWQMTDFSSPASCACGTGMGTSPFMPVK